MLMELSMLALIDLDKRLATLFGPSFFLAFGDCVDALPDDVFPIKIACFT